MGILSLIKKPKRPETSKPICEKNTSVFEEYNELQKELATQNEIISKFSKAEKTYKETGNADEFFAVCKSLFENGSCFQIKGSWIFRYPEALIAEKRYNEAWAVLNKICLEIPKEKGRVHDLQYKVLKAEKRNPEDAIYHLMASYLFKVEGAVNPHNFFVSGENERFLKKAKPLGKQAGLSEKELEYLSYLIESAIQKNNYSDSDLHKQYSKFLKERKSDEEK